MAKKFMLVCKESSEGCDYTIGCGMAYHILKANTEQKAIQEALDYFDSDACADQELDAYYTFSRRDERCLTNAFVVEIIHEIDGSKMAAEAERLHAEEEQKRIEEKERAELERLSKKYRR